MNNHRISFSIDSILAKPSAAVRSETQLTQAGTHLATGPSRSCSGVLQHVLTMSEARMPGGRPYIVPALPYPVFREYTPDLTQRHLAPISVNNFYLYPPHSRQTETSSFILQPREPGVHVNANIPGSSIATQPLINAPETRQSLPGAGEPQPATQSTTNQPLGWWRIQTIFEK